MAMPTNSLDQVLAAVDSGLEASLGRLEGLVAIPSISTDPAYAQDCARAADWLVKELSSLGFDASARATGGHPMVVAHAPKPGAPHVVFYGHYDVQPVDPVSLWDTDPFTVVRKQQPSGETHLIARGTSDDKGQLLTFVEACRAYRAANVDLPVGITMLLEGEEESGSKNLGSFMDRAASELKGDIALICDTDMWDQETPSITSMLRGLVGEEVTITCADKDLHSGMFGNAARNPIQVLSTIISTLRTPEGAVAIEGFYDGVEEVPAHLAQQWRELGFNEKEFLGGVGLTQSAGDSKYSVLEQIWARPTCEINGIWGGYTGEGFKTVIPSKASAKISFRLVGKQDPAKISAAFRQHVRDCLPADAQVEFKEHGGSPAVVMPVDGAFLTKALGALGAEWGKPAAITGSGGSIPVAGEFKRRLGLDSLLIGFAHVDDRIHSPNEKYNLTSYHKGIRSWVRVLDAFAK
jgi:acetylornithine deacetylase/succinyl-diaminopimelate desuccinylase-like protein